jgi:hypothetical protein
LGRRRAVIYDIDFPYRSLYAFQVLNGEKLNDDATGSYRMRQLEVMRIAARHGLRVVYIDGENFWDDDIYIPDAARKFSLSPL